MGCRQHVPEGVIRQQGLDIGTLTYRSPEILCGSQAYGPPADIWACGLTFAEACGAQFHKWTGAVNTFSPIVFLYVLLRQLGSPALSVTTAWPLWPKEPPAFGRQSWPEGVKAVLGERGLELLDGMLAWSPPARPRAGQALEHTYLRPERMQLGGEVVQELSKAERLRPWEGTRHPWRIVCGQMSVEVLRWLQSDPALQPGSPEWSALGVSFAGCGPNFKTELAAKFIMAGYLGERPRSSQLCGLSLAAALPVPTVQAWFRAWLEVNADSLGQTPRRAFAGLAFFFSLTRGDFPPLQILSGGKETQKKLPHVKKRHFYMSACSRFRGQEGISLRGV